MQAKIDGLEIEFTFKQLKFRDQERVVSLISEFRDAANSGDGFKAIREAFSVCVVGWSLQKPIEEWDSELDLVQAVKVINLALSSNNPSETERKK